MKQKKLLLLIFMQQISRKLQTKFYKCSRKEKINRMTELDEPINREWLRSQIR